VVVTARLGGILADAVTCGHLDTKLPKNGKPRHVRLDPATVEILARHVEEYPSPSGYLFTAPNGGPVRHRNFMRKPDRRGRGAGPWAKAIAEVPDLPEGFRFHDLRHSHASLLVFRGWRPEQVKGMLGHGSIRTTYDLYGHLFPVTTMSSSPTSLESFWTLFQWVRCSTPSRVRLDGRGGASPRSPMPHPHREPSKTDTSRHGQRNRETRVGLPNESEPSDRDQQTS
jgi:hypothetical protein